MLQAGERGHLVLAESHLLYDTSTMTRRQTDSRLLAQAMR